MINTDLENASKIMTGSQEVEAIYVGSNLIWNSVPYDAELEYLQNDSNSQAYIDTLISTTNDMIGVDIEINLSLYAHDKWGFGTNTYQNGDKCGMQIGCYNNLLIASIYGQSSKYSADISYTNDKWYNIKLNCLGHAVNVDGIELENSQQISDLGPSGNNILLFARGGNLDRVSNAKQDTKIKYCKIYRNDTTLIRDFIPVRVGQVGYMYDKISGQLFGNNGSGNFILGPDDKLPSEYTKLNYISSTSTGGQYIDLGLQLWAISPISYKLDMSVLMIGKGKDNHNLCTLFGNNYEVEPWPGFVIRNNMNSNVEQDQYPSTVYGVNNTVINILQEQTNLNLTTHNVTCTLFCGKDSSGTPWRFCEARIYYAKIWSQGELVRNLIPCINSESVAGLYDKVEGKFYSSPNGVAFEYEEITQ